MLYTATAEQHGVYAAIAKLPWYSAHFALARLQQNALYNGTIVCNTSPY